MCPYNDCGWCYAPKGVETNLKECTACMRPKECIQFIPIKEV